MRWTLFSDRLLPRIGLAEPKARRAVIYGVTVVAVIHGNGPRCELGAGQKLTCTA